MSDWTPVHHEDSEPEPESKPAAQPKTKPKSDAQGEPAIILTFPPHMIAGIWSLSEALEKNTEAMKELTKELKAAHAKPE